MRKRQFTKNIGILVSNETFDQLVQVTDKEEVTVSEFIRQLIEDRFNLEGTENSNE